MSSANTPLDMWQDLNVIYRRLIYAQALGKVHPSRFYYTVPVCEVSSELGVRSSETLTDKFHFRDVTKCIRLWMNNAQA